MLECWNVDRLQLHLVSLDFGYEEVVIWVNIVGAGGGPIGFGHGDVSLVVDVGRQRVFCRPGQD